MPWVEATGFARRPIVVVEDHLYHTRDLLDAVAAVRPDVLPAITVCSIEGPGPDTTRAVLDWLVRFPAVQVAAIVDPAIATGAAAERLLPIEVDQLGETTAFARLLASLLRPGGTLAQDVQLSTLRFVPADRWWESIYVAATVRGLFADRPPLVRFLSNKRGYSATFGRDLLDAGFDPRAVLDKSDLAGAVVPTLADLFDRAFPIALELRSPLVGRRTVPVAASTEERRALEQSLDLVVWLAPDATELAGRLVVPSRGADRVSLRPDSQEAQTWRMLLEDRLDEGGGLAVVTLGQRLAPPASERAERINLAARHLHTMRSRLTDPGAIVTVQHAYRLSDRLAVGCARRRTRSVLA